MRRILFSILLMSFCFLLQTTFAQHKPYPNPKYLQYAIPTPFESDWMYFRMLRNPLIPDTIKYVNRSIENPYNVFLSEEIRERMRTGFRCVKIKVSDWGAPKNGYISFPDEGFYLVEKGNGYTNEKRNFSDSVLDVVHLNLYDSIFPYDNRFLIKYVYTDKSFVDHFSFHSGNVEWGDWKDTGFVHDVDVVGYIRGVQFKVDNVFQFSSEFSDKIKKFRPNFPNYVYTSNHSYTLLGKSCLIIGAPSGKEDELVEYIYYSNLPEKTGDPDETHYYEMRYILPTKIKSVKERHLEKRRLTDEEQKYVLNWDNKMFPFLERKPVEEKVIVLPTPKIRKKSKK